MSPESNIPAEIGALGNRTDSRATHIVFDGKIHLNRNKTQLFGKG